jgi:hypothetical protein
VLGLAITGITIYIMFTLSEEKISQEQLERIQEAENSFGKFGFTSISAEYPKYEFINIDFFYNKDYCAYVMQTVDDKFDSVTSTEYPVSGTRMLRKRYNQDLVLPVLVVSGFADIYDNFGNYMRSEKNFLTIIEDPASCSEEILTASLCSYLRRPPEWCDELKVQRNYGKKVEVASTACFESCIVEKSQNGYLKLDYIRGPPCTTIEGLIAGVKTDRWRQCFEKGS